MRIDAITQPFQSEFRKIDGSRKADKDQRTKSASGDSSTISNQAKRLSETKSQTEMIAVQIGNQPDIRPEKVAEVKEKIKNGFYDSPELLDKLADKLLKEFGIT